MNRNTIEQTFILLIVAVCLVTVKTVVATEAMQRNSMGFLSISSTDSNFAVATEPMQMTATLNGKGFLGISLAGTGSAIIDWGDGTKIKIDTLPNDLPHSMTSLHNKFYDSAFQYSVTVLGRDITHFRISGGAYSGISLLEELDVSENTALVELYRFGRLASNLDVSKNTALRTLYCMGCQLPSFDVSNNKVLGALVITNNQLTELDLTNNPNLRVLSVMSNRLTNLDVSKNTMLRQLDCHHNQLSSLDVSNNIELRQLNVGDNPLMKLDVSNNINLDYLVSFRNQLTELDVSRNVELTHLFVYDNLLSTFDVSKNTKLLWLRCNNNQLTNLDLSNNTQLVTVDISNNQFTDTALNALFETLSWRVIHGMQKTINVQGNPGTNESDEIIARRRGWVVDKTGTRSRR